MQLIKICLLLLTIFTANFAFAGEPAPNLPDPPKLKIIQGGGGYFPPVANDSKYGVIVTDGSKVAKIIPSVVKVASFASRASNAIGLVQLAYEGIMSGVDYVLDPANNRIIYKDKGAPDLGAYAHSGDNVNWYFFPTAQQTCQDWLVNWSPQRFNVGKTGVGILEKNRFCYFTGVDDIGRQIAFDPNHDNRKTAPFSDVAKNLQNKANTGNAAAQTLINQVVQDMINKNDDEIITAFKAPEAVPYNDPLAPPVTNPVKNPDGSPNPAYNPQKDPYGVPLPVTNPVKNPDGSPNPAYNPQKDPQGNPLPVTNPVKNPDGSPNPNYNPQKDPQGNPLPVTNPSTNPDGSPSSGAKPFELPAFCSWASAVCEFQEFFKKEYKDAKEGVQSAYKDAKKWFTDEPDLPDDKPIDLPDDDTPKADTTINFGGSCPANVVVPFGIKGHEVSLTLMDWSKYCMLMSTYLKPIVIAIASFIAVKIMGGDKNV